MPIFFNLKKLLKVATRFLMFFLQAILQISYLFYAYHAISYYYYEDINGSENL